MKTILKLSLAFAICSSATNLANAYDFEVDGLYYDIISTSELTCKVVSGDNMYSGDVKIPMTVQYKNRDLNVISINASAFQGCSSLTSVEIPNSVTEIGERAFYECSSLTSVKIPNSVTEIGERVFSRCRRLTSVEMSNSVEIIRYGTFEYCSSLTSVEIPNSVTKIGGDVFYNCNNLTSIEIPNSVIQIGWDAFDELHELIIDYGENQLAYTYMSNGFKCPFTNLIKLRAARSIYFLYNSYKFKDVFPNVTDLYIDNFELNQNTICDKVQKLTLGKNATVAWNLRLEDFADLESITLEDPTATIVCPKFTPKQYADLIIYVPEGSLTAYQNAEGWKNFWDIREVSTSGISGVITDNEVCEVARYNLQGQPVSDDYRGFVIIKYSDGTTCKQLAK